MSQLRYDVVSILGDILSGDKSDIKAFMPVHVPSYLQILDGTIHPFSRIVQLQECVAGRIAKKVSHAFWQAVHQYAQTSTAFAVDKDMLESFCEEHNLPSYHIDDLRNQYQRLKRSGYFVKKH